MISVHWIPTHRGQEDKERFARWQPPFVKIVCIDERPPYTEDVPAGSMIVIRNHPMSELYASRGFQTAGIFADTSEVTQIEYELYPWEKRDSRYAAQCSTVEDRDGFTTSKTASSLSNAEGIGAQHAATCQRMAAYCESKGIARQRLLFEGLNEPQLWANEPPTLTAAYYRSFLIGLHNYGLHGVVGNFGVGWPGNGGVQDAPVDWAFFNPVIAIMQPPQTDGTAGDYLGLHEYWALNGAAENWRWWGGRFLQCPYKVPILITECGIDTGVTGNFYGGWYDLPFDSTDKKAVQYTGELWWYAQQCAKDGRVKGIFPFTYDIGGNEWEKFDIRSVPFMDAFFRKLDAEGMPQPGTIPTPPPPPVDPPPTPPPASTYKIVAVVTDSQPNEGVSYIEGLNEMVDANGFHVKPMSKPVQVRQINETDPANWIWPVVDTQGRWAFTPSQLEETWAVRTVDDVREIDSGWHTMDLRKRQMKMAFRWTPTTVTPPPAPGTYLDHIRNMAWVNLGIPYNSQAAFSKYARENNLGNPVTKEYDTSDGYRAQGFAGGIVYCKIGDWSNLKLLAW